MSSKTESANAAHWMIADSQHRQMIEYLGRGRPYANLSVDDVKDSYVSEMNEWASNPPPWGEHTRLNDLMAEAALRKIDLPSTQDAFSKLQGYVETALQVENLDRLHDSISSEIIRYLEEKQKIN